MMNRAIGKLRSRRGESISETLFALLIASLAMLMLAGAIGSASSIVTRSREKLTEYYAGNSGATIKAEWISRFNGDTE